MSTDPDPDDERPVGDDPLPPDDRLWRHPSELGAGINPPGAWFDSPTAASTPADVRRTLLVGALAGACLAGAVMAAGAIWLTRPAPVVTDTAPAVSVRPVTATVLFQGLPTERLAAQLGGSMAAIRVLRAGAWVVGTGVWLDDRGTIVTASPLVEGATRILVTGNDGMAQLAAVKGSDPATGITALVLDHTAGTAVSTQSTEARAGEVVAIMGATRAVAGRKTEAASTDPVVVRVASMRNTLKNLVLHDSIQLSRPVPADSVGGLLVDADGHPVAITLGTIGTASNGFGLAVPADTALAAAEDLRDEGHVSRPWLGVSATDLEPGAAAMLHLAGGATITDVTDGSPASRAGLKEGDVVVAVGDTPVGDATDLVLALRDLNPGDHVTIAFRRAGHPNDRVVALGG